MAIQILKYTDKLKIKTSANSNTIFDPIRKKYIVLTPEEFVRQLFIIYLIEELQIPVKHIAVEREIKINNRSHRFDILVFDKKGNPKLIIECKSHKINLTEAVAIQISKYNIALGAKYLCITNGKRSIFYEIDYTEQSIEQIDITKVKVFNKQK